MVMEVGGTDFHDTIGVNLKGHQAVVRFFLMDISMCKSKK